MPAMAAQNNVDNRFINKTLYKNVYPSTINGKVQNAAIQAQKTPNSVNSPATTPGNRRVVKRPNSARAATTATSMAKPANNTARRVVARPNSARAGTVTASMRSKSTSTNSNRRVVARNAATTVVRGSTTKTSGHTPLTSQQCFSNYQECMDRYCERTNAAYNRCYCSATLAQIDSKYQTKIDSLIQDIIKLKYNTNATDAEIKAYWDETIGIYTQTNPWTNLDNALNIDWASTESRVRGQNAFVTGHSYCVNYLRSCSYMATNLRDAYKSEIERDCAAYEKDLRRIQMTAESVIKNYN